MPAVSSFILQPVWSQFCALIPERVDTYPWGCRRPRIADRIVFDKLVQVLVLGCSGATIADTTADHIDCYGHALAYVYLGLRVPGSARYRD